MIKKIKPANLARLEFYLKISICFRLSESGSLTFSGIQQSLTDTERFRCNLKEFILVDEIDGLFQTENSWWS